MNKKQKHFLAIICMMLTCLLFSSPYTTNAATKVALNTTTSYLVKGETTNLKLNGTKKKPKWTSKNKKTATVTSTGKVKAINPGITYIHATLDKKTYKSKIVVVNPAKIYLDPSDDEVKVDGKAVSLKPSSDTYTKSAIKAMKLTYKVSGNSGVKVSSDGKVTATKAGNFKVTAYVRGKKIETVSMKAVKGFTGFKVDEVRVETSTDSVDDFIDSTYVSFADGFLANGEDIEVSSSNLEVANAREVRGTAGFGYRSGIEVKGFFDGTATITVTADGVTKTLKVIVGQGVNILPPVEAVRTQNYTGYSGNALTTLKWVRWFIDDNNLLSDSMSDRDKIAVIQNHFNQNYARNIYGSDYEKEISRILFDGAYNYKNDCSYYAKTFSFLCECIGIEVTICTGTADNGRGVDSHAWNRVKADGTWYFIDSYWNACVDSLNYFLSETLWPSHVLNNERDYRDFDADYDSPYKKWIG